MPRQERSLYEPSDEVRVFDGSEEDEDIEGSRLPLLIVLALLVLAMFAGFVWLAYTQGVARGRTETPVLTAQAGPARVLPRNPGGTAQPYKGFKIYEQPAPPDDAASDAAGNAPTGNPQTGNDAAGAAPAMPAPVTPVRTPVRTPVSQPAPAATVAAASKTAPAAKTETPKAEISKTPVAAAPSTPPVKTAAIKTAQAGPIGPATAPPRALNKPAPVTPPIAAPSSAASAPAAHAPAIAATGAYALQIGAYKSQADAQTAWTTYKARHAALLAGYAPDIQQADLGAKGIWYRLKIGGIGNKDVASALCDRLKADGGGCFLAR